MDKITPVQYVKNNLILLFCDEKMFISNIISLHDLTKLEEGWLLLATDEEMVGPLWNQELSSMILMDPLQLGIFYYSKCVQFLQNNWKL